MWFNHIPPVYYTINTKDDASDNAEKIRQNARIIDTPGGACYSISRKIGATSGRAAIPSRMAGAQ